eukprot:XP_013982899.1 PREDICTED: unconventional myosin-Va-like [Salmo salar]
MENKIMQLQRKLDEQAKDNRVTSERLNSLETSHAVESEKLKVEVSKLKGIEEEAKNNANRVTSLLEELERLRKELTTTQKEKKTIEDWATKYRDEMEKRQELDSENKKLKHDLTAMRQSLLGNAGAGAGAPGSPPYKVLMDQLNSSCEELEVRKEEVLILRSQLVSQKEAMQHKDEKETMTEPVHYAEDVHKMKDSGAITQAYLGLKETNRSPRFLRKPLEANELLNQLR